MLKYSWNFKSPIPYQILLLTRYLNYSSTRTIPPLKRTQLKTCPKWFIIKARIKQYHSSIHKKPPPHSNRDSTLYEHQLIKRLYHIVHNSHQKAEFEVKKIRNIRQQRRTNHLHPTKTKNVWNTTANNQSNITSTPLKGMKRPRTIQQKRTRRQMTWTRTRTIPIPSLPGNQRKGTPKHSNPWNSKLEYLITHK